MRLLKSFLILLIVTVTSDDVVWATSVWLSIRHHAVPVTVEQVLSGRGR